MKSKLMILFVVVLFTIGAMATPDTHFIVQGKGATGGVITVPLNTMPTSITVHNEGFRVLERGIVIDWTDAGTTQTASPTLIGDYEANALTGAVCIGMDGATKNTSAVIYTNGATSTTTALVVSDAEALTDGTYDIVLNTIPDALIMPYMYTLAGFGFGSDGSAYDTAADFAGYNYVTAVDLEIDAETPANGYLKRSFTQLSTSGTGAIADTGDYQTATITDTAHGLPIGARIYIYDAAATGGTDAINSAVVAALEGHVFTITSRADANTFTFDFGAATSWATATISAAMLYNVYDIDLTQGACVLEADTSYIYPIAGHEHTATELILWFKNFAPSATYSWDIIKPKPLVVPAGQTITFTLPEGMSYVDEARAISARLTTAGTNKWVENYQVRTVTTSSDFTNTPYVLDTTGAIVSGNVISKDK